MPSAARLSDRPSGNRAIRPERTPKRDLPPPVSQLSAAGSRGKTEVPVLLLEGSPNITPPAKPRTAHLRGAIGAATTRDAQQAAERRQTCICYVRLREQAALYCQERSNSMANGNRLDLAKTNETLETLDAKERILWAVANFADNVVLLSSMQRTGIVLMHLFHELGLPNEILFVDTGYHFFETLRTRDLCVRRLKLNVVTLYPRLTIEEQESNYRKKLFTCIDGQPECCHLRKEAPLLDHLAMKREPVIVNGLRREEGGRRANIKILGSDPRTSGYQLSPLCDWPSAKIHAYISEHNLPVHPLYAKSYASIGCYPCTTPVGPGEEPRAGRWRHLRASDTNDTPTYCNINVSDGAGI
jgi:phosphoadenosine phosphosulfate reductase